MYIAAGWFYGRMICKLSNIPTQILVKLRAYHITCGHGADYEKKKKLKRKESDDDSAARTAAQGLGQDPTGKALILEGLNQQRDIVPAGGVAGPNQGLCSVPDRSNVIFPFFAYL